MDIAYRDVYGRSIKTLQTKNIILEIYRLWQFFPIDRYLPKKNVLIATLMKKLQKFYKFAKKEIQAKNKNYIRPVDFLGLKSEYKIEKICPNCIKQKNKKKEKNQLAYSIVVIKFIILYQKLNPTEKKIFLYLQAMSRRYEDVFPLVSTIAKKNDSTEFMVKILLKNLKSMGFLRVEKYGWKTFYEMHPEIIHLNTKEKNIYQKIYDDLESFTCESYEKYMK